MSLCLALILILLPSFVSGTTYQIGPEETYQTFKAFHSEVTPKPGDVIDGGGNFFNEQIEINASGSSGAPITYRNFTNTISSKQTAIKGAEKDWITLHHVTVSGITKAKSAIEMTRCSSFVLRNSIIASNRGLFWYGDGTSSISENTFDGVSDPYGSVIWIHRPTNQNVGDRMIISGNTFTNCCGSKNWEHDGHCIGLYGGRNKSRPLKRITIESNTFIGNGAQSKKGTLVAYNNEDIIIRYNKLFSNFQGGIWVGTNCKNIQVYYNLIYGNIINPGLGVLENRAGIGVRQSSGGCKECYEIDGVEIYNNTITWNNYQGPKSKYYHAGIILGCNNAGIEQGYYGEFAIKNLIIKNNIVSNNFVSTGDQGYELFVTDPGRRIVSPVLENNNYFRDSSIEYLILSRHKYNTTQFINYQSEQRQDVKSIFGDPRFENIFSNNYQLKPDSPCIDAGANVGLFRDILGNRIGDGTPDIGAYEFISRERKTSKSKATSPPAPRDLNLITAQ